MHTLEQSRSQVAPARKKSLLLLSMIQTGILVNGSQITIGKYLNSEHGRNTVRENESKRSQIPIYVQTLGLKDAREGFQSVQHPFSTALTHDHHNVKDHVPISKKPAQRFAADAEHVLIRGLGGLGRYICFWIVDNGAIYLIMISRSGIKGQEVEQGIDTLRAVGASIRIIKADARDRDAVSQTFTMIRKERPIKGVINLAMVLGDAPMATMTGEEWNRALRVKVDSSWILHEETLQDSLDVFILFSSIASVLGNRN